MGDRNVIRRKTHWARTDGADEWVQRSHNHQIIKATGRLALSRKNHSSWRNTETGELIQSNPQLQRKASVSADAGSRVWRDETPTDPASPCEYTYY
ncbi:hypothetical protein MKX08_002566 [Trichoderma sp. CBMAI-0020]|nr:hypothetical protein MKX08_002566 [Trichoderma sp. CBMAI-0020]